MLTSIRLIDAEQTAPAGRQTAGADPGQSGAKGTLFVPGRGTGECGGAHNRVHQLRIVRAAVVARRWRRIQFEHQRRRADAVGAPIRTTHSGNYI